MNREILRLSIPNIISNISVPLLSTVDTMFMGRLTIAHIGAVGLGAMIFNFIYWNFGFLRMGTTGITAQAFGRKDDAELSNTLGRVVILSIILALILLLFREPLLELSIYLLNVQPDQYEMVKVYFDWRILAAPATLLLYAIMGWFFGLQNAVYPLVLTLFINVINIALSAYLVLHREMGIEGVAIGTTVAQYFGLFLSVILILYRYRSILKKLKRNALMKWEELKTFLAVNNDLFIRTLCLTFVFGFFYSQSSKGGEMVLAANVILLQFVNWMSYGIDGFAFASESLVGKYYGAKNRKKMQQAVLYSFFWGGGLAVLYALAYGVFGEVLLTIFTDMPEVIDFTASFLIWMVVFPIFSFASYIWDGVFIGLTASRDMRDSMIVSVLIFLGVFYLSGSSLTTHNLWFVLLLFMVARGGLLTYMYIRLLGKLKFE